MAIDITTNLNDADELVLNKLTAEFNARPENATSQLTPAQFWRQHGRDYLRQHRSRFTAGDNSRLGALNERADATDRATLTAMMLKYGV